MLALLLVAVIVILLILLAPVLFLIFGMYVSWVESKFIAWEFRRYYKRNGIKF